MRPEKDPVAAQGLAPDENDLVPRLQKIFGGKDGLGKQLSVGGGDLDPVPAKPVKPRLIKLGLPFVKVLGGKIDGFAALCNDLLAHGHGLIF